MSNAPDVNLEKLLQMGITAAKEGNRDGARVLFKQVLDADRKNDRAMLWMAKVVSDPAERKKYLEAAIRVNPNNKAAQQALKKMEKKRNRAEQQTLQIGLLVLMGILLLTAVVCALAIALG